MKAGLLGALKGFGEGMVDVGTSIQKRREQALEDARELAKEQRRQAQRSEERAEDRELRVDLAEMTQTGANTRAAESRAAADRRAEAGRQHQKDMVPITEASRKRVADYTSMKSRGNADHARAEADRMHDAQIIDVTTTGKAVMRPDGVKREQILHVRGDGTVLETGQWITPGSKWSPVKKRAGAAAATAGLPDLDEEEEEEEE